MRSHRIVIAFATFRSERLYGQVGDLSDSLEKAFSGTRNARVENPDRFPGGTLYVQVVSDGKLKPTLKKIEACLRSTLLEKRATVTVISNGEE